METDGSMSEISHEEHGVLTQKARRVIQLIQDRWAEEGEEFGEEEAAPLLAGETPPEHAPFPIFIFNVAMLQDVLDAATSLLPVIGYILIFPVKVVLWLIMTSWYWGKIKHPGFKRAGLRWLIKRLFIALAVEFTPLRIIPAASILVILTHNREKKMVRLLNEAADVLYENRKELGLTRKQLR